jgi:hypothetical protein
MDNKADLPTGITNENSKSYERLSAEDTQNRVKRRRYTKQINKGMDTDT